MTEEERLKKLVTSWLEQGPDGKARPNCVALLERYAVEVRREERRRVLEESAQSESAGE